MSGNAKQRSSGISAAACEAEALACALGQRDIAIVLLVEGDGSTSLAVRYPRSRALTFDDRQQALLLQARFRKDPRFARDLFGHLDVEGRVYAPRPARGFHIDFDRVS